jgi:regulator of sigma E protease
MNTSLLGGITFVLVFVGMIMIHEIGHFAAARWMNIDVEEFGFGIPPRMLTLFTWKGTKYTLNWLPLGGFVRVKGEDDPTIAGGMAAAKPWKRLIFLLGGVSMNLLTAVLAYSILFSQVGVPDKHTAVIVALEEGAPAEQAGIKPGDIVLLSDGQRITSTDQMIAITYQNLGKPLLLTLSRDGEVVEVTVTPRTEWPEGEGPMGVAVSNPFIPASSWFATLPFSFEVTGHDISNLLSLPGKLIAGTASPLESQIGGPRSIWNFVQAAVTSDVQSRQAGGSGETQPTYYTLMVIIALSISLGTLNLLPIPALDGGRILFLLPELLFHKTIPAKYQVAINGTSFILLIMLLTFFYIKDFINPIAFNLP